MSGDNLKGKQPDEYEVEGILGKREIELGVIEYEVKWAGYSATTWEPANNLNCVDLVNEYEKNGVKKSNDSSIQNIPQVLSKRDNVSEGNEPVSSKRRKIEQESGKDTSASEVKQKAVLNKSNTKTKQEKKKSAAAAENIYSVEAIVNKQIVQGIVQYEVKWQGYAETTWEPLRNLQCSDLIDKFEKAHHSTSAHKPISAAQKEILSHAPKISIDDSDTPKPLAKSLKLKDMVMAEKRAAASNSGARSKLSSISKNKGTLRKEANSTAEGSSSKNDVDGFGKIIADKLRKMPAEESDNVQIEILKLFINQKY